MGYFSKILLGFHDPPNQVKFVYIEKATKICDISTLLLTCTTQAKSQVKISQNFVAFSEYMNPHSIYLLKIKGHKK